MQISMTEAEHFVTGLLNKAAASGRAPNYRRNVRYKKQSGVSPRMISRS